MRALGGNNHRTSTTARSVLRRDLDTDDQCSPCMNQHPLLGLFLQPVDDTLRELEVISVRNVQNQISLFDMCLDQRVVRMGSMGDGDPFRSQRFDELACFVFADQRCECGSRILLEEHDQESSSDVARSASVPISVSHCKTPNSMRTYPKIKMLVGDMI
jgi:hypothetical protein